jgi:hypothetical protein
MFTEFHHIGERKTRAFLELAVDGNLSSLWGGASLSHCGRFSCPIFYLNTVEKNGERLSAVTAAMLWPAPPEIKQHPEPDNDNIGRRSNF